MAKETHEFQAETKQLLDLMVHSIYTNHEIFLRELISNASDALDKLHFAALTDSALREGDESAEIFLVPDEESHTLSISDNGIGMTAAGSALALGVFPRTSALALAGLLVPTTLVGQAFWKEEDERKRSARLSGALSNAAIIGGLLLVAARRRR